MIPGIDDVAEIRWEGSVVGRSCSLWVRVGLGEIIRQLSRSCEHLARIIRTIYHFNLRKTRRRASVREVCIGVSKVYLLQTSLGTQEECFKSTVCECTAETVDVSNHFFLALHNSFVLDDKPIMQSLFR